PENLRRLARLDIAEEKQRRGVVEAEGSELQDLAGGSVVQLLQLQLGVDLDFGPQVVGGETFLSDSVEALAEFVDARLLESHADGLAVAAEAHEDVGDRLQRVEQMEGGNGAAGALDVAGAVVAAKHQRGAVVHLDDAAGNDADDTAVPLGIVEDEPDLVGRGRLAPRGFADVADDVV